MVKFGILKPEKYGKNPGGNGNGANGSENFEEVSQHGSDRSLHGHGTHWNIVYIRTRDFLVQIHLLKQGATMIPLADLETCEQKCGSTKAQCLNKIHLEFN